VSENNKLVRNFFPLTRMNFQGFLNSIRMRLSTNRKKVLPSSYSSSSFQNSKLNKILNASAKVGTIVICGTGLNGLLNSKIVESLGSKDRASVTFVKGALIIAGWAIATE
jgi:hypothetical protein